ncbi:F-box and WD repeat domain containing protein 10B [Hippopotamus amphibius kiboko]|uniref:F-box and WD repeat domain containing protein 10B n=1 Tax=Hippopotamus amphibius kiboko TaxID=575201 RepID=UPI00259AABF4|nr:F-box and WD repeat domain containing protein 10B [Hippopotamus amphibius kiboko]
MENLEARLKNAPYLRCEKGSGSVPLCQKCESCVLAWKIFSTKEWFRRVGGMSQRRFLVSILQQLDSLSLLHYFQNILQSTQGKDFIYHRSRVNLCEKEGKVVKPSLNQMPDKTVEQKMREILSWFGNSSSQTKASYTLRLLQLCGPQWLLTAADVIRVLLLRGQNDASGNNPDSNDVFFFPEKGHTPPGETSQFCLAAKPGHTSLPLSKTTGKASLHENAQGEAATAEAQWKSSLQCISEMNRLFSEKASASRAGSAPAADVLVGLDAVRDLSSGVGRYRDFIRHLPVHLSKHILSMLGKNSLNKCAFVSQHWAAVVQQVKADLSMHSFIQHQITFLQGSYTRGIDPNYANRVVIPVPKVADDGKRLRVKNHKWKLRVKNDYNLWTAYQNQETQQVQMEERNVFCGAYNIRILSDMWDRNRVIHYSGGDLLAVSSNRKIQLLDIIQIKQIPIKFRGHAGSVRVLFLCEEENFLLSGSYDLSIRYWDLKSGACMRIFSGHQGTVTCMDVYKNKLASGAKDCQVKEWDIDTGKCLKTFKHKDPILATRINDTYIVSSCEKGTVKVWHVVTAQLVKTLSGHEGAVKCLCFDQWHLLSGSADGLVMAWSMVGKYERCLMAFKHPKEVLHVALLFLRVISACADGKIRIYNLLNGNCLKVMKANGRGDPVLSFFIQGNRMVINTEGNVLLFQFENIKWQYSLEQAKQKKDREEDREENGLTDVLSKSSTQIYSPRDSVSSKQTVQESPFNRPHRSHILLRASRLPTGVFTGVPPSQGKPKSPGRDGRKRPSSREVNGTGAEQENSEAKPLPGEKNADDVEKVPKQGQLGASGDLISRSKKKSWCIPVSPDRFLLTVDALQKARNSGEFAYPRRPQTQVIDAWGPSISYPRKVLSLKGQSVQHAVDRLRFSNPPTEVKQTSIPLEIQKLQPNLKNSVHSPRVQSTIPQPVLICPRFSGSLKGEDRATSLTEGVARSFSPLTSTQVIKPNRMLAPPMGRMAQAASKDRPRFYTALDPFRVNTEFMLLTVKEEKEYGEARMRAFQAVKPARVVDPEKARRAAWVRKIKGLPIDSFMKQGKIAAPELGQDVFI